MKIKHVLTLGAALLLAPLASTLAQSTWETVDELTPWRGRAIVADSAGNFISLAIDNSTSSSGPVSTAVSFSGDTGLTWQTVGFIPGYALKLAAAPDGTLYASGNRSATVSGKACVWQSVDHGATWTASNPWSGQPATLISMDITVGNSGTVYLCGWISGTYSGGRWIVRKGQPTSAGITWTTVDGFSGTQPNAIAVRPGPATQSDYIVVCGQAKSSWTVRRSADGGTSWATIDANSLGTAQGATVGADGSIYVIGRSWLVRKSANGGATWSNVDSVANAQPAYGPSIRTDAFGRVFAVGWIGSPFTWLVRGSVDGGATWVTTDTFLPTGYTRSQAMGVACDSLGNVCVVGETGTSPTYTAPIRRLAAP